MAGRRRSILALALITSSIPAFPAAADETIDYTYDAGGRLTKVVRSGQAHPNTIRTCYTYDRADNRTNVTVDLAADCVAGGGGGVSFSIASDGPVTEGSPSTFTISKVGTATGSMQVSYSTANGTAAAPGDYTAKPLTVLTFLTSETQKSVSVITADDALVESSETFSMNLSSPSPGTTISTGTATATLNDNDTASPCTGVTFSITGPGAVTEGTAAGFTINRSPTTNGCSVNYSTANGSAVAPGDYVAISSTTLSFAAGQATQTVNVTTNDDAATESAETFTMSLASPSSGATIGTGTATATINDNDGPTGFSISNDTGVEGGWLYFTVTKSGSVAATVNYATANGTATSTSDYYAVSGQLSFTASETTKTIAVQTRNNTALEVDEIFYVNLSGATGVGITDGQGVGSIYDDDEGCQTCLMSAPEEPEGE